MAPRNPEQEKEILKVLGYSSYNKLTINNKITLSGLKLSLTRSFPRETLLRFSRTELSSVA